jgi:hypothetical protein
MAGVADLLIRLEQAKSSHQAANEQLSAAKGNYCLPSNPGCALSYAVQAIRDKINDGIDSRRTDVVSRTGELVNNGSTDWAGYDILKRYLAGGEDWRINNDPRWTEYMKAAPGLEEHVRDRLTETAQTMITDVPEGQTVTIPFEDKSSAETDNGYLTGYQLLHGTNIDVGGYQIQGTATVTNTGDGYTVRFDASHTWNDIIDSNPKYQEDTIYNTAVELFTLGQADPYNIHVSWDAESTIQLDQNGMLVEAEGWPSR